MASLEELAKKNSDLEDDSISYLQDLTRSWGLLADLSFSDLLLYLPTKEPPVDSFVLLAHVRPTTSTTLYRADLVGQKFEAQSRPVVSETFLTAQISNGKIPVGGDREISVMAIPVIWKGETVAILASEKAFVGETPRSEMERTYLSIFDRFAAMFERGEFPYGEESRFQHRMPRLGDGLLLVNADGQIEFASPNAVSLLHRLGWHRPVVGSRFEETGLSPKILNEAFSLKSSVIDELEREDKAFVVSHCFPLLHSGKATGAAVLVRDVTELRRRDRQLISKDATIREIHHRVKNNLQTISSLLRIQGRRLDSDEAQMALNESVRRIGAIAIVHETLAVSQEGEVTFGEVMRPLVELVKEGLSSPVKPISIEVSGDTGLLPSEVTTTLAVVVTELLQNALDHGFKAALGEFEDGRVDVVLSKNEEAVMVEVSDNGVGLPEGFDIENNVGLGLTIVKTFIQQELEGSLNVVSNGTGKGVGFQIYLPSDKLFEKIDL
ncbi:MAG: sensor histidine kinase [Acidimicrobiales bacterium]